MQNVLGNAERVLTAVIALALFALNDIRMFHSLPRVADPGDGRVHGVALQLMGAGEMAYASMFDLALRWGLAGLTVVACAWAIAETLPLRKTVGPQDL